MNHIRQYVKTRRILILLSLIFFLIRLPFLDMHNLLHDERDIVFSGYALAHTGHDLLGHPFPISFPEINPKTSFLSVYYSGLWSLVLPVRSPFFARLPYVLASTAILLLAYELILLITANKRLAFWTSVVLCFSPWMLHVTQLALELNIGIPLILGGAILYIRRHIFLSFGLFFLAFYGYQAHKVVILFLICYLAIYMAKKFTNKIEYARYALATLIGILILLGSIFFIDAALARHRSGEIIFLNTEYLTKQVNFARSTSIAPGLLKKIMSNKLTASAEYMISNLFLAQDPSFLFSQGDPSPINGPAAGGQFYLPLFLFYYLGFFFLGSRMTRAYLFPVGFILVGLTPSLLSSMGPSFGIRGAFAAVGYAYIIALGILYATEILHKSSPRVRTSASLVFFICMITSLISFAYTYALRRPVLAAESFFENERQVSLYLKKNSEKHYTIYHHAPNELYLTYTYLNNSEINSVRADYTNHQIKSIDGLKFQLCDNKKAYKLMHHVVVAASCLSEKTYETYAWDKRIRKIPYHDGSGRFAYFIFE